MSIAKRSAAASTIGARRRIQIDNVDLTTSPPSISGKDKHGLTFQLTSSYNEPGVIAMPQQGEQWIIEQYKQEWRLKFKVEDLSQFDISAGDKVINTNSLLIALASGGSLTVVDSGGNPIFKITEDGTYHMLNGATWQTDL